LFDTGRLRGRGNYSGTVCGWSVNHPTPSRSAQRLGMWVLIGALGILAALLLLIFSSERAAGATSVPAGTTLVSTVTQVVAPVSSSGPGAGPSR
jgi:hypothetical protein